MSEQKVEVCVRLSAPVDNFNAGEEARFSEDAANNLVERGLGVIVKRIAMGRKVDVELLVSYDDMKAGSTVRYLEDFAEDLVKRGICVITNRKMVESQHPLNATKESGDLSDDEEAERVKNALLEKDQQVARSMFDLLSAQNPDMEEPNLEKWAKDIGKLRKSGPGHDYIKQIFVFARGHEEWSSKVKTPTSLQKHFAEIRVDLDRARAEIDNPVDE